MYFPRIIAICGSKRSGKDTVADILVRDYGYKKIKIAEHLKSMLQLVFGFDAEQLETNKKDEIDPKWGVSPRHLMQYIGTEIMQYDIQKIVPGIGRNIWIKRLIDTHIDENPKIRYVISDLRFIHEYQKLKVYDTKFIQIHRHDITTDTTDTHSSENEYKSIPCHIILDNDSTILCLKQKIDTYMNEIVRENQN